MADRFHIQPRDERGKLHIFTRITRITFVGAYLTPSMLEHLPDLEEALQRFRNPIVLGYLNVYLDEARILQIQSVLDLLAEYGIIDLVPHFQQRRRFQDLKTW